MRAEPSRLIPQKPTGNLELLFVTVIRSLTYFVKTFMTRSQQIKLESWKVENTQLPKR